MRIAVINTPVFIIILQLLISGCLFRPASIPYIIEDREFAIVETTEQSTAVRKIIETTSPDSETLRQRAETLFHKREMEKARQTIKKAAGMSPLSEQCQLSAGKIYYHSGDYFKAINHLLAALTLNDRLLPAYYFLALSYDKTGKTDQAINQLEKSLKIKPLFFDAVVEWVSIKSRLEPAPDNLLFLINKLKDALKMHPPSTKGALLLSDLYSRLGETHKAAAVLKKRLEAHGNKDQILSKLAQIKYQAGQIREAYKILKSQKQPDIKSQTLKIKIKSQLFSLSQAAKEAERLSIKNPSSEEPLILCAELKLKQGKAAQAERAIQKSLLINPNNAEAYHFLAKILKAQGDPVGARWALSKAFSAEPENPFIMISHLQQLLEDGQWKAAEELINRGPEAKSPDIMFIRALIAKEKENYEQAEKLLIDIVRKKYSVEADAQLADIEILLGKFDQAGKRLQRADKLFPNNIEIALSKARLFFQTKKINKIPSLLRPFLRRPEGLGKVHILLAEALGESGKIKKAVIILEQAFKRWPENQDVIQTHTFYLGLNKQYDKAIQILEKSRPFKGRYKFLLPRRLKYFYFKSGKIKQFQLRNPF